MKKKVNSEDKMAPTKKVIKGKSNWLALKAKLTQEKKEAVKSGKVVPKPVKKFSKEEKVDRKEIMDNWFDVDPDFLNPEDIHTKSLQDGLVKKNSFEGLTKCLAMDCEMVGVGEGGRQSVLARVSLVNRYGQCVYDKFVKSREEVTDYRTFVSGVRPSDLENADTFEDVQKEVADLIKGRILVGHAIWNDMKVLFLDHPKKHIRDTAKYRPFRELCGGRSPALRILCKKILGLNVQKGEHSSVTDAQATMRLYTMHKKEWEKTVAAPRLKKKTITSNKPLTING